MPWMSSAALVDKLTRIFWFCRQVRRHPHGFRCELSSGQLGFRTVGEAIWFRGGRPGGGMWSGLNRFESELKLAGKGIGFCRESDFSVSLI
jgi:hypothetical protein